MQLRGFVIWVIDTSTDYSDGVKGLVYADIDTFKGTAQSGSDFYILYS